MSAGAAAIDSTAILAVSGQGPDPQLVSAPVFDGLSVVLAVLGGDCSESLTSALERADAWVRVTSNLTDARRSNAALGSCATVVIVPLTRAITGSLHAGLRALSRQGVVLVLSVDATTRERIDLLNSGADSVLASVDPDEVVAALAAVLRRSQTPTTRMGSQIVCAGEICVNLLHRTATAAGRPLTLTLLEFDLLAYFVAHAEETLSRDRLLENVWGYDIGGRETVTVHVCRLRRKIEADPSRPTLLQTVWGIGYRLNTSPTTVSVVLRTPGRKAATLA